MKKVLSLVLVLMMALAICPAQSESLPVITLLVKLESRCMPMEQMTMFNDAAAAAGVTLKWIEVRSGWDEKKAVTLAGNNLPDIFIGALNDSDVMANKDLFVELTDLIEQYAPNIQKMYENCPEARIAGTFGDGIYSLPLITAYMPHSCITLNINKEWLDKLGLEVPTTIDEMEEVMIAFRDGDPNGNGIQDEIAFDWPPAHYHDVYALTGAYGVVDSLSDSMVVIQDGKISFLYENEAFYKLTQRVHKWYEEGLITPEVFTNDYAASNALCASGDIARVGISTGWSLDSRFGQYKDQYICIPQLHAEGVEKVLWPCNATSFNIQNSTAAVLTKNCKDPVAAIKLLDQFYTDDFGVQSYYGSFDTGMTTKYDDGTYSIQCTEGYDTIDEAKWFLALVDNGVGYFSPELQARTKADTELTARLDYDNVYKDVRPVDSDIWPKLAKFTEEDSEELSYVETDILTTVNQKIAQWIVKGGIEDEWEGYLKDLNAMGLEDLREIYQHTYDDYMSQLN